MKEDKTKSTKKKVDKDFRKVQRDSGFRWLFYTVLSYVILLPLTIPLKFWVVSIGISLVLGLLFWFLNEIMTFQRIQLGQRFPGYPPYDEDKKDGGDKPDELIKS
jgi:hypothetical protein